MGETMNIFANEIQYLSNGQATHYDRQGNPISPLQRTMLGADDPEYYQVGETYLEDGTRISTIWLGINCNSSDAGAPPILFETMVFGDLVALPTINTIGIHHFSNNL